MIPTPWELVRRLNEENKSLTGSGIGLIGMGSVAIVTMLLVGMAKWTRGEEEKKRLSATWNFIDYDQDLEKEWQEDEVVEGDESLYDANNTILRELHES
jgi:hypothetical protein